MAVVTRSSRVGRRSLSVATSSLLLLWAVTWATLLSCVCALYEDQLGQFDWHHQHVGHVSHAHFFHSSTRSPPTLLLASSHSLLTSLPLTSTLPSTPPLWHTPLHLQELITSTTLTPSPSPSLLALSHPHGILRSFNPHTGSLQWESSTLTLPPPSLLTSLQLQRAGGDLSLIHPPINSTLLLIPPSLTSPASPPTLCATLYPHPTPTLRIHRLTDGEEEWSWTPPSSPAPLILGLTASPDLVHLVTLPPPYTQLHLTAYTAVTGAIAYTTHIDLPPTLPTPLPPSHVHVSPSGFVTLLLPSSLLTLSPAPSAYHQITTPLSSLLPSTYAGEGGWALRADEWPSALVLSSHASHHILTFHPSPPSLTHVKSIPSHFFLIPPSPAPPPPLPSPTPSSSTPPPHLHFAAVHVNFPPHRPQLVVNVYAVDSDEPVYSVVKEWRHGQVERGWLEWEAWAGAGVGGKKGGRGGKARVVVVGADHTVGYVEDAEWRWERGEALASITELAFTDLPPPPIRSPSPLSILPSLTSLLHSFHTLIRTDWLAFLTNQKALVPLTPTPSSPPLHVDEFGLRKLVIASTAVGRLIAFESEAGTIVWSEWVTDNAEGRERIWRVVAVGPSLVLVITAGPTGYTVLDVDALTGAVRGKREVTAQLDTVVMTPYKVGSGQRIVLLTRGGEVWVHPHTAEALALLHPHLHTLFYHFIDLHSNLVTGYALSPYPTLPTSLASLRATQLWQLSFPHLERIAALAPSHPFHTVQSSVRLVGGGEGGLLYKYLNPNLLVLATERGASPGQPLVPSVKKSTDPSISLYLIDTVTGALYDKLVHRGCAGPVQVVQSENVVVYHYANLLTQQHELSVVELYEPRDAETLTLLSAVQAVGSTTPPLSSFTEPAPLAIQQSYIVRTSFKALAITHTLRGITGKEVLTLLPTDQLLAIPKALLDPRRPVGEPTHGDKMDGLIPYSGELMWGGTQVVTANRTVTHARGIGVTGVLLESTSVVCVWGVDVWCGRLTPSATFDLLNEDFNYPFLLLTVTAVIVAILVTRHYARKKELMSAWK